MRLRLCSLGLAALLLGAIGVLAADRPPKDLHLVGDHWTAWDPPAPPADAQVHVIVPGDTLWDLAAKYYSDPYLWPQLWERNQYILDAHWIYPGDPLVLGPQVAAPETVAAGGEAGEAGEAGEEGAGAEPSPPVPGVLTSQEAAGTVVPLGFESDIYCSGYIGETDEEFPYHVVGSEYEALSVNRGAALGKGELFYEGGASLTSKVTLSTGDIVYLDGGRSRGLSAGLVFTALAPDKAVTHPTTGEVIGRLYLYQGRVRVLAAQEETAIAEVVHTCSGILIGSALKPFEPEPIPLGRPTAGRPINFPAAAEKLRDAPMIVYAKDELVTLGEDHVVFINVGADRDVTPGDIYTIYRENRPGWPPVVLGELAVVSVHPRFSVARIIDSRYVVYVGDRIDAK
jgi:hypothetical protein